MPPRGISPPGNSLNGYNHFDITDKVTGSKSLGRDVLPKNRQV